MMSLLTRHAFQLMSISCVLLEIKEQNSHLESQGVHTVAESVVHGSV